MLIFLLQNNMFVVLKILFAPVAQLDRASDYGSEGWGFESSRAYKRKSLET